jgi:hypothetical protein
MGLTKFVQVMSESGKSCVCGHCLSRSQKRFRFLLWDIFVPIQMVIIFLQKTLQFLACVSSALESRVQMKKDLSILSICPFICQKQNNHPNVFDHQLMFSAHIRNFEINTLLSIQTAFRGS